MTDREQIYKAWQAVGADLAGLQWDDFVAALAQPEQEPSGWRLVPVEPTQEMLRATEVGPVNLPLFCWKAMLSAAPNPPQRTWQGLTDEEELIPMPLFADWPGGWKE